jgi:hypothetical protein
MTAPLDLGAVRRDDAFVQALISGTAIRDPIAPYLRAWVLETRGADRGHHKAQAHTREEADQHEEGDPGRAPTPPGPQRPARPVQDHLPIPER